MRILADLRTPDGAKRYLGAEEYPSLCLVARKQWLDGHKDAAGRFARAFLAANRWMANHGAEEIREALPAQARHPTHRKKANVAEKCSFVDGTSIGLFLNMISFKECNRREKRK